MAKTPKRPRDPNQLAKLMVDIATGESAAQPQPDKGAQEKRGRAGGLTGGKARANSLTPERRTEISRKAASSRWSKAKANQS